MSNLLIRGGTVIDGTGAKGFRADVRVRGNRIAEVAANLKPESGEKTIDADGAYVTPGFIDCHTHYDGPMWWMPTLDPLPGYGTTTAVMGNCGLSVAPMSLDAKERQSMIGIFSFLEDIPQRTFEKEMPWNWRSWEEYRNALLTRPVSANLATFVGHLNLRIAVMGAAAWERKANAEERDRMAALLEEALRYGAMGLSTNFFDDDANNRPVPSKLADDAELEALIDVLGRYPGTIFQFIANLKVQTSIPATVEHVAKLCRPRKVRVQFLAVPAEKDDIPYRQPIVDAVHKANREGADVWAAYGARPLDVTLNFERTLAFALQGHFAWDELANKTPKAEKIAKLQNAEWRAKARHEWDNAGVHSVLQTIKHVLNNSQNGAGPTGITLKEYAGVIGMHESDAMADWLVRNGVESTIRDEGREIDEDAVIELLDDPAMVTGANDAGAHGQLFCGGGEPIYLLTHYCRDLNRVPVEKMVHALTGKVAGHYNLTDRGVIAPGKIADLTVFAMDEIQYRPEKKAMDVPDGDGGMGWRWTRDAAPMRATIVDGITSFEMGKGYTEQPGKLVGPGQLHATSRAAD